MRTQKRIYYSKLTTFDNYIAELKRLKVIFRDESNFRNFMFEYACSMAEHDDICPIKASKYIERVMIDRVHELYIVAQKVYWQQDKDVLVSRFKLSMIPELVRSEHGLANIDLADLLDDDRDRTFS